MANTSTEKWTSVNILTILPQLKSIRPFFSLISIPTPHFDPDWLTLFEFLTYNMSFSNPPLKNKIEDLKFLIQLEDSKPQIIGYLQAFDATLYLKVIGNYFHSFTKEIKTKQFYNKKDNLASIRELLQLVPHFYHQIEKTGSGTRSSKFIDESISSFLFSLKENSKKYEKNQLNSYESIILKLSTGDLNQLSGANDNSNNTTHHSHYYNKFDQQQQQQLLPLIPKVMINNYSFTIINNNSLMIEGKHQQQEGQIKSINNHNKGTSIAKSASIPYLIDICNKQYDLHLTQAKFYLCDYYKDKQYIMRKIGSYTLGLNTSDSCLDYVIQPKNSKTTSISYSQVTQWLNRQIIYGKSFTFSSEISSSFCKRILLFTSTEINPFEKRTAKVYLYNERYKMINQLFRTFFTKGSVFFRLYVFFNGFLCLESGFQLGLLLHGFFISHYKLYTNEKKYYSYKCLVQKDKEVYALRSKAYFNIEVSSHDLHIASNDNVDTLIPAFLSFFIQMTAKMRQNNQKDLIKRKNYLFSLNKVVKYLLKNKDKDYWEKIINFYGVLIEKSKLAVPESIK